MRLSSVASSGCIAAAVKHGNSSGVRRKAASDMTVEGVPERDQLAIVAHEKLRVAAVCAIAAMP